MSLHLSKCHIVARAHLLKCIREFDRTFVLAPADKAANNVVIV